jgi:hypothetical protein
MLRSHLLPPPGMGIFHVFLLWNLISPLLRNLQISNCDLCMHTTQAGNFVTRTLLFHTYYSCAGTVSEPCTHNHTTYLVCAHGDEHICFNPPYSPREQWLEVQSANNPRNLISHTQMFDPGNPVSMLFDACAAIDTGGCGGVGCGCGA